MKRAAAVVVLLSIARVYSASADTAPSEWLFTPGWATFGIPMPQGKAAGELKVGDLTTQTDVKCRWPDGSIKFAVISAKIPEAGRYPIVSAARNELAPFTPVWPRAVVTMTIQGTPYRATLTNFTATDSWLAGPLVREGRVRLAPLDPQGNAHPFLRVLFDVRSFNDGTHRVDVIGENTLLQNASTDRVDYDLAISVNGSTVYSRATRVGEGTLTTPPDYTGNATMTVPHGLSRGEIIQLTSGPQSGQTRMVASVYTDKTVFFSWPLSATQQTPVTWRNIAVRHFAGSRWRKTLAVGGYVEAEQTPDFRPHYESRAFPEFLNSVSSSAAYAELGPSPYDVMNLGIVMVPGNSAGGRAEIGPYPQWSARYLVHRTQALRRHVLGEGTVSGTFPIHWGDTDEKPLISLDDYPTFWRSLKNGGKGLGIEGTPGTPQVIDHFQMDTPHVASLAFIPYVLTGDRYYLDEMRFWANWSMLTTYNGIGEPNKDNRGGAAGYLGVIFNGARGWGWGLRNLADVAAWAPDDDPYKSYFKEKVENNLRYGDSYAEKRTQSAWDGFLDSYDGYNPYWPESDTYPKFNVTSLWQNCYLGWAVDRAIQLGFDGGRILRGKILRQVMNIVNDPAVPPAHRAPYRLYIGVINARGEQISWFQTPAAAFAAMDADPKWSWNDAPYLGAYYGPEVRLIYQIAERLGMQGGAEAMRWLESYVDPAGTPFMKDLNGRSQFATASVQREPAPNIPAAPRNLRIEP